VLAGAKISGVNDITTSPKSDNPIANTPEKVKGIVEERKEKTKGRGFTL
jgi:hypothetical protein